MVKVLSKKAELLNEKIRETAEKLQSNDISLDAKVSILHETEAFINQFQADAERISGLLFRELQEKNSKLSKSTINQMCMGVLNPNILKSLTSLVESEGKRYEVES
jgi:hypothetical protein